MKLEEILQKIVDNKNICKQFLKLTSTEDIYKFLREKYDYEDDFKTFCEIVEKSKNEFLKISEDENFDKVSGGKSYKEYLKSIGITGLSGIMAFSGMGDQSRSSAFDNLKDKISSKTEKLNPADAQALAIGVPSALAVGSVGVWLIGRFIKNMFSGGSPTNQTVQRFNTVRDNPASLDFGLSTPVEGLFSDKQYLFVAMQETYNTMLNREDISSYGPTFWRQWYASVYVYVKFHLENKQTNILNVGFPSAMKEIANLVGEKVSSGSGEVNCGKTLDDTLSGIEIAFQAIVTEGLVNAVFSEIRPVPTPSLISSICQWDNELKPGNLLALKIAIDQDWESIKTMSGNDFLNCAGRYTDEYRVI